MTLVTFLLIIFFVLLLGIILGLGISFLVLTLYYRFEPQIRQVVDKTQSFPKGYIIEETDEDRKINRILKSADEINYDTKLEDIL